MGRTIGIAGALILVFAAVAALMVKVMTGPLKDSDYLVIGTVSTLAAMLALFLILISTSGKKSNVFFKRRKKS
jgi:uncharacterized membrane protein